MKNIEKNMHVKVVYDPASTLVLGYYPSSINYSSIPEPFIQIENDAQVLDKQMCVINVVYQEYIKSEEDILEELQKIKIAECKKYLESTAWQVERLCDPSSCKPLKEGVAEKRALARSLQDKINSTKNLLELKDINLNF